MKSYTNGLKAKWVIESADLTSELKKDGVPHSNMFSLEDEEEEFIDKFNRAVSSKDIKNTEDVTYNDLCSNSPDAPPPESFLNMELGIRRREDNIDHGLVKSQAIDVNGKPIGVASATNNPLTDTRAYEVEFLDRRIEV